MTDLTQIPHAEFTHAEDCPCFSEQHSRDCRNCECQCLRPPTGWYCTREVGHSGPCAAIPAMTDLAMVPHADLAREWVRRLNLKRDPHNAGRKKKLHPCPVCGKQYGVREMRAHRPGCKKETK